MATSLSSWRTVPPRRMIQARCSAWTRSLQRSPTTGPFDMARPNGQECPRLVMSRTPLRVSFAGGGTDLPGFYRHDYGAVVSTAINKYIYVTIKAHGEVFDEKVRVTYSKSERVQRIDEVENDIARECLRFLE